MHAPINRTHATTTSHLAAPLPSADAALQGRRILVLDDDPLLAVIASLDLEDAGASFALVHDEASALVTLEQATVAGEPFDAAVLDVHLGEGRTSRSVAEQLRAMGVPFVFHTGDPDALSGTPERWMQVGGGDAPVVSKPAPIGALTRELSRLMDIR